MGLRAAAAATVEMSGAEPSARGGATEHARALALARAGCAAVARGVSRRARDLALKYACSRRQGGVAIVEHEAVRAMLAAMEVRLAAPRPALAAALAAKIAAGDEAVATTTDAVQVLGGTGYMHDSGVEKLMRDAKYCQLFPEPNWATHAELLGARSRLRDGPHGADHRRRAWNWRRRRGAAARAGTNVAWWALNLSV